VPEMGRCKMRAARKCQRIKCGESPHSLYRQTVSGWRFIHEFTFTTANGPEVCMDLSVLNEAFATTVTSNSYLSVMPIARCDNKDDFLLR